MHSMQIGLRPNSHVGEAAALSKQRLSVRSHVLQKGSVCSFSCDAPVGCWQWRLHGAHTPLIGNLQRTSSLALGLGIATICIRRSSRACGRGHRCGRHRTAISASAQVAATADSATVAKPVQIVKIDLETNSVVIGEEEIQIVEQALKSTQAQKVAVVGIMGAFRTGKSFLLDLMLRYLKSITLKSRTPASVAEGEECVLPSWAMGRDVPAWAVECGSSMTEGREDRMTGKELDGFAWRPGMDKCTEGVWIWSEAFVCPSQDGDIAVLLMDTQGAWDAKMTKEQSATVYGLTTLLSSRLIYNVSKQIQQDKVDNLLYFTDFAQAALRTKADSSKMLEENNIKAFQTLEFLVRDWPHYSEDASVEVGREMMVEHLAQWKDPKVAEDTTSMDTLYCMYDDIDVWCLPHPSLSIERSSWDGDLAVIEPEFWRFINGYFQKIFSPTELRAKTSLGTPLTVDSLAPVIREFTSAFKNAAPQAQSFAQAMETSTALLAKNNAVSLVKQKLQEKCSESDKALEPETFEKLASETSSMAQKSFTEQAIFGSKDSIEKMRQELSDDISQTVRMFKEENDRKLDASLSGLTDVTLAAGAAFIVDRVSDLSCDWWSGICVELSKDLSFGYTIVALYIAYSVNNLNSQKGQLNAAIASTELLKSVGKRFGALQEEYTKPNDPKQPKSGKPEESRQSREAKSPKDSK